MSTGSWGPGRKRAALSVTFDNLGEAGQISLGTWPEDAPAGAHYTATEVLPRLLGLVRGIKVTYFIEGVNAEFYPAQLAAIRQDGHEIALHAWRHEGWNYLKGAVQDELLTKSLGAMGKLGIQPRGFRPPAGEISADGLDLLKRRGFDYCSPLGAKNSRVQDGLVILPFQWRHVDAYMLDPALSGFRAANGVPDAPLPMSSWTQVLRQLVTEAIGSGEHRTVIFHPYLFGRNPEQWQVLSTFLDEVTSNADLWVAPHWDVAEWMRANAQHSSASSRPF